MLQPSCMYLLLCSVWKQVQLPPRKHSPVRRLQGEKRHKKTMSGGEQWPFRNISSIPQLQTAVGLSIGEVAVPAGGRALPLLATAAMHWRGAQWEEHINASIQDIDRLGYCSTGKQPSVCTRRKALCCNGEPDSSHHVGISCSGSLLDIYGRLEWRSFLGFFSMFLVCFSK